MTDPEQRTVSCHAVGLIGGTGHELQAILGVGALLPHALVQAIAKTPVDEIRPIEVRMPRQLHVKQKQTIQYHREA